MQINAQTLFEASIAGSDQQRFTVRMLSEISKREPLRFKQTTKLCSSAHFARFKTQLLSKEREREICGVIRPLVDSMTQPDLRGSEHGQNEHLNEPSSQI